MLVLSRLFRIFYIVRQLLIHFSHWNLYFTNAFLYLKHIPIKFTKFYCFLFLFINIEHYFSLFLLKYMERLYTSLYLPQLQVYIRDL